MEKKEFESRAYEFEIRAERNENNIGVLTGRPIVYNSPTDLGFFREEIVAGALDKTDLRDVRFLVNHDLSKIPLARSRNNNGNSTMTLRVDEQGLGITVDLDVENNSDAANLYSAVSRGDVSGMSFMFTINKEEWSDLETEYPTRKILEIGSVIEVSAVTFPAYESTEIQARSAKALESAKLALESAKRGSLESDELNFEKEKAKALLKVRR